MTPAFFYQAPFPWNNTGSVRRRIEKYVRAVRLFTNSRSIAARSGKFTVLRPRICQIPVIPGFTESSSASRAP